jgi:restriction system protein
MPIPTYDLLFRPILELATHGSITRRSAMDAMIKLHALTPEEIGRRLPTGGSTIANRTGWAMTFLTKAGLIAKVAPKTYAATPLGLQFLAQHPERIREADLRTIPGYKEAWAAGSARRRAKESERNESPDNAADETATPHEIINREVSALRNELRSRLLDAILAQSPEFFEQLVLDVLIAMGYGGSKEDAAEHLGQSGDEGIDGCINQDTLGLDQVMVQAKRYRPDRTVSRAEVQGFIGSLSGQGVTKGVFITTSTFVQSAHEFVARGLTTKVVLVDGEMLIDLMIKHHIGARVSHTYELYELDQNYFDDDE